MDRFIEIYTEELPPAWRWTPEDFVGGTHEFVVETARNTKADIVVYYDGEGGVWDNIYYLPRSQFKGEDVVLACNSRPPKMGRHNIIWFSWDKAREADYLDFDERIVLSPYHQSLFGSNSRIVPLSCNPKKFNVKYKIKKQCLYSSSPDRGGEFLKSIWKDVERETGARLVETYKSSISEAEMVRLYCESEFWLHPCQGIELFCISAVKAQVASCIPVVIPNMALATTVKYGVKTTLENYKKDLINAIKNPPKAEKVDFGSWETVTEELFKEIK
jgi:hypothetical protein